MIININREWGLIIPFNIVKLFTEESQSVLEIQCRILNCSFSLFFQTITPCPTKHQDDINLPSTFTPAKKPFHVGAKRFHKNTIDPEITPG